MRMPVIKSLTRKDRNFGQLIKYIFNKDQHTHSDFTYFQNIYDTAEDDVEKIIETFKKNDQYRKKRKGGITVFHEILAFSPKDNENINQHPEFLEDIGKKYIELRAPESIAIIKPHHDKDHVHLHIVFSANAKGSSKNMSIRKKDFRIIKEALQEYQKEMYPDLVFSFVDHGIRKDKKVLSDQKKSIKNKSPLSDKASLLNQLKEYDSLNDIDDFIEYFESKGLQPYYRHDILQGVVFKGKKYRVSTLLKSSPILNSRFNFIQQRERKKKRTLDRGFIR